MRVLLIGATGQLGRDLVPRFADQTLGLAARKDAEIALDLADSASLDEAFRRFAPELVINTAAAHNVPACEEDPAQAYAVNATGVAALADACNEAGARLLHVSTDYVFGPLPPGESPRPFKESDTTAPLNVYAASKLAGEHLLAAACADHAIVRSSGLYGAAPCLAKGGRNFVQTMLDLASERDEVRVVTDEVLTPTPTSELADQIHALAFAEARGVFHATCQGETSWHDFAAAIFEETGTQVRLLPATSEDFPSPVRRPSYSALDNERLRGAGLDRLPDWREGLRGYLESQGLLSR